MSDVRIRPMVREDLDAVLDLVEQLNRVGEQADPRYQLAGDWRPQMRAFVLDSWFGRFQPFPCAFLADAGGSLVGFVQGDVLGLPPILVRPPTVRIGNLWVDPAHRRRGLATRLVRTYVDAAEGAGFPWVEVGTLARDARAVGFWTSAGFTDWRVILLHEAAADPT